jgi:glutathione peroxidase
MLLATMALFAKDHNKREIDNIKEELNSKTFYDYSATSIDGKDISMSEYKGKVIVIVNVASKCGFTPQYEGLQALYEKYEKEGLVVLGFPSNQFANQEPASNEEIQEFCTLNYGVTFPMFSKIDVNGDNAHPLYVYLKSQQSGFPGDSIKWNFTKFLVDRKGKVVERYASTKKPESMEEDIVKLLGE